jgi:hypothetical protein
MKNLHILQTDKPPIKGDLLLRHIWKGKPNECISWWRYNDTSTYGSVVVYTTLNGSFMDSPSSFKVQNIYITNSEEIKVGDYITDGYKVWQWKDDSSLLGRKKIILTTNKLLIKDGVQEIDDNFLEWFVKNPSCENVEVDDYKRGGREVLSYIIIIPKEELPIVNGNYGCTIQTKKQETIEEASERILANNIDGLRDALKDDDLFYFYKGIIQSYGEAMAKYQAEKMYSEINVKKSFENESLKWWMSLTMDEQVEIGLKYNEPTFNLTLRAIIHEFSQFKKK